MASNMVTTPLLRLLLVCGAFIFANQVLAQNAQPVTAPARTITDGNARTVISKSTQTTVTLNDGTKTALTSEQLQAYNTKPTVTVNAEGKPDLRQQPVNVWIDSYRDWMKANPTFKATLTKAEYEFVRQNNFGGLYAYLSQQARQQATRAEVDKQNNR